MTFFQVLTVVVGLLAGFGAAGAWDLAPKVISLQRQVTDLESRLSDLESKES